MDAIQVRGLKKCVNLNTFLVAVMKAFNRSCKYCVMKYAGAIQSLVECCDVCQPLELRTVNTFVCRHTFCASRKAWFKSLSKILL